MGNKGRGRLLGVAEYGGGCQARDATSSKPYSVAKDSMMDGNYSLPDNVAIVTLQAGEDPRYSEVAEVDLKKVFGKRTIKELTETNLSANQKKSEMKQLNWRVIEDAESGPAPVKGGPVDCRALVVALGPMEIRTFLLKF
ncbi:putative alpha-mannosidase [Zea mays]|uniref:Putative alpha-mannosidase n=1 Tax=Zea mays TaxID=4577 RepID=A0A1D6KBM1_MAIZE|nr:putative alpha-mannosidase [Zea mays]ONM00739.1 putative alpha-mannosidase [Zea mays]